MVTSNSLKSVALISVTAAATALLIQVCGGSDAGAQTASNATPESLHVDVETNEALREKARRRLDVIEGVWDSTVTVKDCTTDEARATFKAIVLFNRGGTITSDTSPNTRGVTQGIWKHGTGSAYSSDAVHFRYNPDGTLAGTNNTRRTATLSTDGNSFSSNLAISILDTSGAVVATACSTETAVRVAF